MRTLLLLSLAALPALAQPRRLAELLDAGPAGRTELLDEVRRAKEAGDPNGAIPLAEALIAYDDGRALEAGEFAARAASAKEIDLGDKEALLASLDSGLEPPRHDARSASVQALLQFLIDSGEESCWRGKDAAAKQAWTSVATLAARLEAGSTDLSEALALANLEYRARHRLAGLALRAGNETEFRAQAALACEAHASRTALAAAPAPATSDEWRSLAEIGPLALVRDCPDPPDHPVAALLEAPKIFSGKSPAAVLLIALGDKFGDRALPLKFDAAMALLPHVKTVAPALRKIAASSSVARALLARAGEPAKGSADLEDPWDARVSSDAAALEAAFKALPKLRRVAVATHLAELKGEDEVFLGN